MNGQAAMTIRIPLPGGSTAELLGATGSNTHLLHSDWLGSARISADWDRQLVYDTSYAPYGENYDGSSNDQNFTGQSPDTLSGLYDFLYREHSPVQGRWISPDPSGMAAVDPSNPQSWNRYAYVLNGPMNSVDPSGLQVQYAGFSGTGLCNIYPVATPCVHASLQTEFQVLTGNLTLQQQEANYVSQLTLTLNTPPPGVWVPAGGDYQGTGCLRQGGGDVVWCPKLSPASNSSPANNGTGGCMNVNGS
jgi:RHS repeat-associated protein